MNVQERVITIKGDIHQLITASNIIIDKIKGDPQSASCPNISYSGISGPVANANPTGSPYASGSPTIVDVSHPAVQAMLGHFVIPGQHPVLQATVPTSHYITHHPSAISASTNELSSLNTGLNSLANYTYGVSGNALGIVPGLHSNLQSGIATSVNMLPTGSLAGSVSPIPATTPFLSATALPFENGGTIQAAAAAGHPAGIQAAPALSLQQSYLASLASAGYLSAGHHLVGTPRVAGGLTSLSQPTPSITPSNVSVSSAPSTPIAPNNISSQPSVSLLSIEKSSDGQKEIIDLSIPENLIGAILGKAGRTLVEFQEISGAKIQISKKGEYVAGTRDRKVTITGAPPSPQTAQFLITQRIAAAQAARAQQAKIL